MCFRVTFIQFSIFGKEQFVEFWIFCVFLKWFHCFKLWLVKLWRKLFVSIVYKILIEPFRQCPFWSRHWEWLVTVLSHIVKNDSLFKFYYAIILQNLITTFRQHYLLFVQDLIRYTTTIHIKHYLTVLISNNKGNGFLLSNSD